MNNFVAANLSFKHLDLSASLSIELVTKMNGMYCGSHIKFFESKKENKFFLCLADEKIIGAAEVRSEGENTAKLLNFVIDKHFVSQGYGSELLRYVEEKLFDNQYKFIRLIAGNDSAYFYEINGYKVEPNGIFYSKTLSCGYRNGIDHLVVHSERAKQFSKK